MSESNMSFAVDANAVLCNMLYGEIKGRQITRKNAAQRESYIERGIINSSPSIKSLMIKHPNVFRNSKLIHSDGSNFFGEILSLSPLSTTPTYKDRLRSRMRYEYDLSEDEILGMESFLDDFDSLRTSPDIEKIVQDTSEYKNSIEAAWKSNEKAIMEYIISIIGYEPENIGKVSAYIVYPTFNTHRCYQLSQDKVCMFFAKRDERDINKILAYLAHQAVHQPMLPYKPSMTKKEKELYHAFIKFLTDKEIYNQLSGKSYLDIVTENENSEAMGKVYPFWLAYRYRNAEKEGKDAAQEISKAIKRDKAYYDSLPLNSKKRRLYSSYEFDKLDANKISLLFREKRSITPYEFAKLDFDDRSVVYQDRYVKQGRTQLSDDTIK